MLALAATLAPLPPPADVPGASLTVRLPALVQTLVLALFALSALLFLLLQRPRRAAEARLEPVRARRRAPAWAGLLSLLPFVALLGAVWYYVANRAPGDDAHPIERAITAIVGLMDLFARARPAGGGHPRVGVLRARARRRPRASRAVADARRAHARRARAAAAAAAGGGAAHRALRARALQPAAARRRGARGGVREPGRDHHGARGGRGACSLTGRSPRWPRAAAASRWSSSSPRCPCTCGWSRRGAR